MSEKLSEENRALIERLESHLGISPQTADYLIEHWGQANILLNAARAEARPAVDREALVEINELATYADHHDAEDALGRICSIARAALHATRIPPKFSAQEEASTESTVEKHAALMLEYAKGYSTDEIAFYRWRNASIWSSAVEISQAILALLSPATAPQPPSRDNAGGGG